MDELTSRDRAILRAVAGGGAELSGGAEPDLFLDGRCCADQVAAHRLANAGLITAAVWGVPGSRVAARLTTMGLAAANRTAATAARGRRALGSPA